VKGLSHNLHSLSQQTFNRVTPKNIKLKFMKINGNSSSKPENKAKLQSAIQRSNGKPKIDLGASGNLSTSDLTSLHTPQNGLKSSKAHQSHTAIGLGTKYASASHKRLPTAKNTS